MNSVNAIEQLQQIPDISVVIEDYKEAKNLIDFLG